jgi:hypothetical protein
MSETYRQDEAAVDAARALDVETEREAARARLRRRILWISIGILILPLSVLGAAVAYLFHSFLPLPL